MYDTKSQEFSYLLGFFWGDGGIKGGSARINIIKDDAVKLIHIFEKCLDFDYREFTPSQKGVIKRKDQSTFRFTKEFKSFLIGYGYLDKSLSSPSKILSVVDNHCFWRGYFDADGCFYKTKNKAGGRMSFTGDINQDWSDLFDLFKNIGVKNAKIRKVETQKGNCSRVELSYGQDILKFGNYIYSDAWFGLERKKKKFESIKESLPKSTSKTKGVCYNKTNGYWRAYKKRKHLGWFKTEEEAIKSLNPKAA